MKHIGILLDTKFKDGSVIPVPVRPIPFEPNVFYRYLIEEYMFRNSI